tara:strand:- start:125 stop:382 length:258 start_codon:yes stop_codon:yes gene_type:complete
MKFLDTETRGARELFAVVEESDSYVQVQEDGTLATPSEQQNGVEATPRTAEKRQRAWKTRVEEQPQDVKVGPTSNYHVYSRYCGI